MQIDWGHFGHIQIGRARRPLMAFVAVLSYSRRVFVHFSLNAVSVWARHLELKQPIADHCCHGEDDGDDRQSHGGRGVALGPGDCLGYQDRRWLVDVVDQARRPGRGINWCCASGGAAALRFGC